jgi:hypothetical protein
MRHSRSFGEEAKVNNLRQVLGKEEKELRSGIFVERDTESLSAITGARRGRWT